VTLFNTLFLIGSGQWFPAALLDQRKEVIYIYIPLYWWAHIDVCVCVWERESWSKSCVFTPSSSPLCVWKDTLSRAEGNQWGRDIQRDTAAWCYTTLTSSHTHTHTHTHSQSAKVTCLIDARPRVIIFSASPFVLTHTLSSCLCSRARVCVCCGRSACESIDIHKFTFFVPI